MESFLIGQLGTDYTFKIGVRKVTAYNCSRYPVQMKTLVKFGLRRSNADEIEETALSVFSKNAGITIGYATNDDVAPTVTVAAGGSMTVGDHYYYIAYSYGSSETLVGTISAVATTSSGQQTVNLTAIPLGATGCTSRKIYKKTTVGGAWYLRGTLSDNTTTTFTDTAADNTTTAAPTTSTAYDIKWGSTYGGVTTPVTVSGDDWWIEVVMTNPSINYETRVQSTVNTNPIWQENDDNIPLDTTKTLTATLTLQGSAFSGKTRNVQKFTFLLATSTSTLFFLKFMSKYVDDGTDLTSLSAFSEFPMYPIKDTDGGLIYVLDTQMAATTTYKFNVWVVTSNAVAEVEVYAKVGIFAGSPTLTTIVNNTYNTSNPPFSLSSICSNGVQAIVDRISGSLSTIDIEHRKLHYGKAFIAGETITALNGTLKYTIQTNNTSIYASLLISLLLDGAYILNLHEASSGNSGGTALTLYNKNRIGTPITSESISVITTGVTVTTNGTQILPSLAGVNYTDRIILKPNTLYTIEIITTVARNGTIMFEWLDNGLDY